MRWTMLRASTERMLSRGMCWGLYRPAEDGLLCKLFFILFISMYTSYFTGYDVFVLYVLTLSLPVTHICINFSTVYNDTLVTKELKVVLYVLKG